MGWQPVMKKTGETYTRLYNPKKLPLLDNWRVQEALSNIYIDSKQRYWLYNWPVYGGGSEIVHLLDSTGSRYLKDTAGLTLPDEEYFEYRHMTDLPKSGIWIFGLNTLFSYSKKNHRYNYYKNDPLSSISIHYEICPSGN